MKRALYFLLMGLPVAFTIWSCGPGGGSCDHIPPNALRSGTYTTTSWSDDGTRPIQATGTTKTMVLDASAGTLVLSYANRLGEEVVERWSITRVKTEGFTRHGERHF